MVDRSALTNQMQADLELLDIARYSYVSEPTAVETLIVEQVHARLAAKYSVAFSAVAAVSEAEATPREASGSQPAPEQTLDPEPAPASTPQSTLNLATDDLLACIALTLLGAHADPIEWQMRAVINDRLVSKFNLLGELRANASGSPEVPLQSPVAPPCAASPSTPPSSAHADLSTLLTPSTIPGRSPSSDLLNEESAAASDSTPGGAR